MRFLLHFYRWRLFSDLEQFATIAQFSLSHQWDSFQVLEGSHNQLLKQLFVSADTSQQHLKEPEGINLSRLLFIFQILEVLANQNDH